MSGIQNIKKLSKEYKKAKIYFHMDFDGVFSALVMKNYLANYGIETVELEKIQYGDSEYTISKPSSDDIMAVLVDFAHGKSFIQIHTDHHDSQIFYKNSSRNFKHAKSNTETISNNISSYNILSNDDIRIINMIDSAGYLEENITPNDMNKATFDYDYSSSSSNNHIKLGLACGKLLLAYKNKPNFFTRIINESEPSVLSIYNTIIHIINENVMNGVKGWVLPETINQNSLNYFNEQSKKRLLNGSIESIREMKCGQSILINNCIFQIGGGQMNRTGSFDRYTAFRLYPKSKYFIMLWDSIGMMQISKNPWNNSSNLDLGKFLLQGMVNRKFKKLLHNEKYKISLLTMKKIFEKGISENNYQSAIGFNYNEMMNLLDLQYKYSEKKNKLIEKFMNIKGYEYTLLNLKESFYAMNFLNSIKLPLTYVMKKLSGGHPSIQNIQGLNLVSEQRWIDYKLKNNINPFIIVHKEKSEDKPKYEPISTRIYKSMAIDIIKKISKKEQS